MLQTTEAAVTMVSDLSPPRENLPHLLQSFPKYSAINAAPYVGVASTHGVQNTPISKKGQ